MVEGGFPECAWDSRLFAEYRELVGGTTEAPDAFLWGALAGALSFLIGQDARYPWGAGFQPPTLLVALVGTTGKARKSTAIDDVLHNTRRDVLFDLSGVTFLGSPGLHALMHTRQALEQDARRLLVVCPSGAARRVLELAGVAQMLEFFDSRAPTNASLR